VGGVERIDLAHEQEFALGGLLVRPALRQLVRGAKENGGGEQEVVEPRVMQVLVALARAARGGAGGGIVSRDDLTHACWEGRVVGEDAINRVISRLRRSAEGIGEGAFRIETITKVGYRLVARDSTGAAEPPSDPATAAIGEARKLRLDRRATLIGGGLAVVGAGGYWGWRKFTAVPPETTPPPEVAALMIQALNASQQGDAEGSNQAQGLLRRVTEIAPDYADGWGMLAGAYGASSQGGSPKMAATMRARAIEAANRAFALDKDNPYARLAVAGLHPKANNWLEDEKLSRSILVDHPTNRTALRWITGTMLSVGRCREGADLYGRLWALGTPGPGTAYSRIVALWSAGRIDEADRAANEAAEIYPTQFAVWFTRFYLLLYTGRAEQALAMAQMTDTRPSGFSEANFQMIILVAEAMISRKAEDIDRAIMANMEPARRGAGFAENAIQFASALGRVDTAFEIAEAYYFSRGFEVAELRFEANQLVYTPKQARRTRFLFMPSTTAMRADPRFEKLVDEIGLKKYWQQSGSLPDYKRYG
jgi:DNA-binding winged helix-turn-helix (wHTH) protein/tetratricopeptide (TPR) repeat protein